MDDKVFTLMGDHWARVSDICQRLGTWQDDGKVRAAVYRLHTKGLIERHVEAKGGLKINHWRKVQA